jgi:8-oxo-dGTP diphosphatase
MDSGASAIICSHNPILPKLLKKLIGKKNFKELGQELKPAEAWVLHHRGGEIIAIDWVGAPNT